MKPGSAGHLHVEAVEKLFSEWPLLATFPTLLRRGSNACSWHVADEYPHNQSQFLFSSQTNSHADYGRAPTSIKFTGFAMA